MSQSEHSGAVAPAVRFEHITKRFPGVLALHDVSVDIAAGSCHALCGENGAGKSTLGKILAGIHAQDEGRILVHGREVRITSPRDALAAGVGMVHQELAFCENMSVAENLCLSSLPAKRGFVDRDAMVERANAMLEEIGTRLDVRKPLGTLSIAQQQMVQIASAVGSGARILVFDEPTSSLSQGEADRLYDLVGRLTQRGVACIYVSHRMPEVFRLCDTVTVLRDGQHVGTRPTSELTERDLVQMMIGRPLAAYFPRRANGEAHAHPERLRADKLTSAGKFHDVSLTLRAGEIVGLAGLVGAGRSELAAALFGLDAGAQGTMHIDGVPVHLRTPRDAIRKGLGLVPEDRKKQGLVPMETGLHNLSLSILERLSRFTWLRRAAERALGTEFFAKLRVRSTAIDVPVASLSGGNQQKIVLARWLAAGTRILLLDEPTRGVDVGAKAEIHALISDLAEKGAAILLISSELPEVLSLSDRVLVMRAGHLVGEVRRDDATQDGLLRMMAGLDGRPLPSPTIERSSSQLPA